MQSIGEPGWPVVARAAAGWAPAVVVDGHRLKASPLSPGWQAPTIHRSDYGVFDADLRLRLPGL